MPEKDPVEITIQTYEETAEDYEKIWGKFNESFDYMIPLLDRFTELLEGTDILEVG